MWGVSSWEMQKGTGGGGGSWTLQKGSARPLRACGGRLGWEEAGKALRSRELGEKSRTRWCGGVRAVMGAVRPIPTGSEGRRKQALNPSLPLELGSNTVCGPQAHSCRRVPGDFYGNLPPAEGSGKPTPAKGSARELSGMQ